MLFSMFFWHLFICLLLSGSMAAVSPQVLEKVRPYLLPENHAAKKTLDRLFATRPLTNEESLKKAGFQFKPRKEPEKQLLCAKHPKLRGYLVKTYLDTQHTIGKEERNWISRIQGAEQIRKAIAQHHYQKMFKVPKKWIYLLPDNPSPPRRRFVLIVEDMHILERPKNIDAYFFQMSRPRLDALFTLLTENLLIDSIYIDNIPFCKDGRIAFIDTEHFNATFAPLGLHLLTQRLCPPLAKHWSLLISNFKQPNPP